VYVCMCDEPLFENRNGSKKKKNENNTTEFDMGRYIFDKRSCR